MPIQGLLAQVPLFSGLAPEELDGLTALIRRHRYAAGETIFHEGDAGTALYIIDKGEVKIVLGSAEGKEVVLSLFGPEDFFGELALLDGEPRSADAVAKEHSELLILQREDFAVHDRAATGRSEPHGRAKPPAPAGRSAMHDAAFLDVRTRLIRALLELAQTRGQAEKLSRRQPIAIKPVKEITPHHLRIESSAPGQMTKRLKEVEYILYMIFVPSSSFA